MARFFGCTSIAGFQVAHRDTLSVLIASSVRQLEVMVVVDRLEVEKFNSYFLLAASHYMPSVGLDLIRRCRDDIEYLGYERAKKMWLAFIENTLNRTNSERRVLRI
jgi:hypothetical protein